MTKALGSNQFTVGFNINCNCNNSGSGGMTIEEIIAAVFDALGIGNGLGFDSETNTIYLVSDPSVNSLSVGADGNFIKLQKDGFAVVLKIRDASDGPAMLDVNDITLGGRLTRNGATAILGDGVGLEKDSFLVWSRLSSFPWSAVSQAIGDDDGIDVGLKRVSRNNLKVVGSDLTTAGNLSVGAILPFRKSITLAAEATTLDASNCNGITVTGDAGGNGITTISNGVDGQHLTIIAADNLVTIFNGGNIVLKDGDWISTANKRLDLYFDGTNWIE